MKDQNPLYILAAILIALSLLSNASVTVAGTIELSVPDTCAAPDETFWLPIFTTDLTDSGVYGYNLIVHFDSSFVEIDSVTSDGTISALWGGSALIWNVVPGEDSLRIVDVGISALTGDGMLVRIAVKVPASAPTDSSTQISIPSAVLRDDPEKPPTITHPGWLTVPCPAAGMGNLLDSQGFLEIDRLGPSKIRWQLAVGDRVAGDLHIYDALGRLVRTVRPRRSETSITYTWKGRSQSGGSVAGGVYFYEISTGERSWKGKIGILK